MQVSVAMPLLGMIAVDLLTRFTHLFDHDVARLSFDDALDRSVLVSRDQDKPVALSNHPLIHRRRDLNRLKTGRPSTLAMKGKRSLHPVLLGASFDPLVDAAEHLLVAGSAIGKLHPRILAN
jgi:hypothetical protein